MALGNMSIKYGVAVTDHIPLAFTVNVGDIPVSNESALNNEFTAKLDWSSLTKDNLLAYYNNTDKLLSHIHLPKEAILCKDANCKRVEHKRDLCSMYDNVVSALYDGVKTFYKTDTQNKKINIRPGWNEHVAMYHTEAREAYKLWDMA